MNNVILDGSLYGDVTVRPVNKTKVANFALLQKEEKSSIFIQCEGWGNVATELNDSLSKGDKVIVSGELKQDSYEKDGEKKTVYKIRVKSFAKGNLAEPAPVKSETYATADVDSDVVPF